MITNFFGSMSTRINLTRIMNQLVYCKTLNVSPELNQNFKQKFIYKPRAKLENRVFLVI